MGNNTLEAESTAQFKQPESQTGEKQEAVAVISYISSIFPTSYNNVIISRWLRSLRHLNDYFKLIDKDAYFPTYEKYIKSVIHRPGVRIKLAVLESDKDVVFGWSVIEGDYLHYVHVQELYRKKGIATLLIPDDIKYCTHITKHWLEMWPKKYKHIKFNPFQ